MFVTAKVFFDDKTANNIKLIREFDNVPADFVRLYKKHVAPITPVRTGWLRRSIMTQVLGNTAKIGWRATYAAAQNEGGHTQEHYVRGWNMRDGGMSTIKPGTYRYPRGKGFADRAAVLAELELDKEISRKLSK